VHRFLALSSALLVAATGASACALPEDVRESQIVPVIRSNETLAQLGRNRSGALPTRRLNEELSVVYVQNTSRTLQYFFVPPSEVDCWTDTRIQDKYMRNVVAETTQVRVVRTRHPGVRMVAAGGNFEPSFLLSFKVLQEMAGTAGDQLYVAVPNTDILFIQDPTGPYSLAGLRDAARDLFSNGNRRISPQVFRVTACSVEILPPEGLPQPATCN
jgi:uncharacterized protein YtpQ (UPF0354 family)